MTNLNTFNAKINEFPTDTTVRVSYYSDSGFKNRVKFNDILIPTKEVFQDGNFASRLSSGVKFSLVEKWLKENDLYPDPIYISGLWSTLRIL